MKNVTHSIQNKLKDIAKKEKKDYNLLLLRFFHERLLYRLSISKYRDNFFLKGGVLLYAIEQEKTRPTKDIDFLGKNISNDLEVIKQVFIEICTINLPEDAINFDISTIEVERINEEGNYEGVRVNIVAFLGKSNRKIQIDIGFGDFTQTIEMEYPILLENQKIPKIRAYSIETIIAEKFQAMISLGEANSRMKDFYDVHKLLSDGKYDKEELKQAIKNTFERRETFYMDNHPLFQESFAKNENLLTRWKSFLRKHHLDNSLSFEIVLETIKENLLPIYQELPKQSNS